MVRRVAILFLLLAGTCAAQTFPQPSYFQKFFMKPSGKNVRIAPVGGMEPFIIDGKLRLSLADAVQLTLENNTDIKLNELQLDTARWNLTKTYAPFDPVLSSTFSPARSTSPSTTQLTGASTLSSLAQNFTSQYSQLFESGTLYNVSWNAYRNTTNSSYATLNPSISSALTVSLTQNLLRNRGFFAARAPIIIAQRNLKQSRANFEASVMDSVLRAMNQYWDVVQARESLKVTQSALDMADATYKQNKRMLELGALPPLDIYRSESQVAQQKLRLIQSQYALRQVEDEFRRTIGADLDPRTAVLDLDLTESAENMGDMAPIDLLAELQLALQSRPELEALRQQSENDDTNIKLAHNNLQPELSIGSFYSMNGVGGHQITTDANGNPLVVTTGGLSDALDQLGSMNFPGYGMTLSLRLPLRNRGAEADLGNAMVGKRRDLYKMRRSEQQVTIDVKHAADLLEQAKLSVTAAKLSRDLSQKNLEAEQRKYELGAQTIFFVLDAQTQLSAAQQSLVQAQIDYHRAVAQLDRATGQLLVKNRIDLAP
ncbi:MAG: TolC family protein [Terriglobales bacterium]